MLYILVKLIISALIIVTVSEIAKTNGFLGGLLASLPLTSLMAFIWLYNDTKNVAKVAALSLNIFWLVLPSLSLFLALPWLLKKGFNFYPSLALSLLLMLMFYGLMLLVLKKTGV